MRSSGAGWSGGDGRPPFVLHDHRLPRPHHDLRLAEDGVLRSWALPKGLPTATSRNRLAIAVPDHDLDHLTYEDASKTVADTGWWELVDRDERRTVFVLHGRTGAHRYALVTTRGSGTRGGGLLLHLTVEQPPADQSPTRPPAPPASRAAPS